MFVCTANMCRSPMAAALFRRRIGAINDEVLVGSAGLLEGGYPSPREVLATMDVMGIDLSGHRSAQVTAEFVAEADIVVGMARRHAREIVLLDANCWPRTFTLKELVRRGEKIGEREPGEALSAWLADLHYGRERMDIVGRSAEDDVTDPLGGPLAAYKASARELEDLVGRLADLLFASIERPPSPG
jgi:protein-tyrosine phosphatase